MPGERLLPEDPLTFIKACVDERRILWTYHVNMRLEKRAITRQMILDSTNTFEIIESYTEDKYLPSYLVLARQRTKVFHVLFATDVTNQNVRAVTAYYPSPETWDGTFKRRSP